MRVGGRGGGAGMSTCGVTAPVGAHNNLPPVQSRTQSSLRGEGVTKVTGR